MPKDSAPTRSAILAAALQTLKRDGLEGFAINTVARRAGVAKGLVLYHFKARRRLLALCARRIEAERARRLSATLAAGSGAAGADRCWQELLRQQHDGLARAWLGLRAAGITDRQTKNMAFEEIARQLLVDGCTAALVAGVPVRELKDAFDAVWLALLAVAEAG